MGDRETDPAGLERNLAGPAGLALSGALPARTAGVDQGRLAGDRNRTTRQVLQSDPCRSEAARPGACQLGTAVERRQSRRAIDVAGAIMRWANSLASRLRSLGRG